MPENPLLRRRIAEIAGKLAAVRGARDALLTSPATDSRSERLKMADRETAILNHRMKALLAQLVSG